MVAEVPVVIFLLAAQRTASVYDAATNGASVNNPSTYPTASNTTYYAHWTPVTVTVTLNANGGSITTFQYTGAYGTALTNYTAPTFAGYTFKGWKLASEPDSAARMSLTYPAANTTYVAVWAANSITVTFDANGGMIGESGTQAVGGVPLGSLTAPTPVRSGYDFKGWYTSPTVGTKLADKPQFGYADATYYAHWSASEITVTMNDGTNTAQYQGNYGNPIAYAMPVRAGSTFLGWKVSGSDNGTAAMFPTYPAEATAFEAVWAGNQVTLTFNPMGGKFADTENGVRTGYTGGGCTKPADPARTGYTFDAWYTATAGGTVVTGFGTYPAASVTYYAHWNANTVTVKLAPNGGKIDGSTEAVTRAGSYGAAVDYGQMTKGGSQFRGWKLKGSEDGTAKRSLTFPAAYAEYTAVWTEAVTVTVKYSANGGTLDGEETFAGTPGTAWTAPDVEDRAGYTFLGWGLDPFGSVPDHQAKTAQAFTTQSATTYYALWQADELSITLDPNGGKFGDSADAVDKTGTIDRQLDYTIPAWTGYAFVGWAETDDATVGDMFPTFTVALDGKTLYAVWKANTVSVAFFAMGGSGNAVLTGSVGASVTVPDDPTRTGCIFDGWYTEQNGEGTKLNTAAGRSIALGTETLAAYYANWTEVTYTATLDLNGGNIGGETADVIRSGAYGAPVSYTEPALAGSTFTGWKAEGSDTVTKFITFPADNATFTAQWRQNSITVTFNPMDGSGAAVLSGDAGSALAVPADPARTGYIFRGWSLQPISTDVGAPANTFQTASVVYYAQWTAKTSAVTLKLNGGTVEDKQDDVTLTGSYGAVVAYTAPVRSGYTFSGWKPEGGKDEDAALYLTYPLADSTAYEAVWKAIPSGGGGIGGAIVTVPVSSDEGRTHASVSVKDDTAIVSATEDQIREEISGTRDTGTVVVDISDLKVSSAVVPASLVSAAQTAENSTGLTVALPAGSVSLDKTALDSAGSSDIKIEIQPVDPSRLNDAQREQLGTLAADTVIIDVNVYINNVLTHTFNDGKIDVSVPYTPKAGESADAITVWYLADNGSITPMRGVYDPVSGTVSFTTTHLSSYVIASLPFTDVSEDSWYYGDVAYVCTHGLFDGTTDTTFSPAQAMTRGMLVTVLWRMENKPAVSGACPFDDVKAGSYYESAVIWAASHRIVEGYTSSIFRPDDDLTREQMAAILWRYAKYKGCDVSVGEETNILSYEDAGSISAYAVPALQWACGAGLIQGDDRNLMPAGAATRAQVAAVLARFCRNAAK